MCHHTWNNHVCNSHTSNTCRQIFNDALETKLLHQIVMLTVTFSCSNCWMIDGTEYSQEHNGKILLLALMDKHGITLVLNNTLYFRNMKSFLCSVVQYFNKVSQCWCIRLFMYVSNVAADATRLTCCYFILATIFDLFRLYVGCDCINLVTPWLFDILMCCYMQNNSTDLYTCVNSKISHVCKSNIMSHGNVLSCGNATSHENSTSHLMEIIISMVKFGILYVKYCVLPMYVHMCRNKVTIEWYRTSKLL